MFCPKCGAQIPGDARFCGSCGAQLRAVETVAPPRPTRPARRRRVAPLAIALGVLVVVAAAGAVAWFSLFAPYDIDEKNFPDPALRAAVAATYDSDGDGTLSRDEGRAVTSMSLSGCAQLSGLGRFFPNVTSLTVTGGSLTALDTSDLTELIELDVSTEPLSSLDVGGNRALTSLSVPDDAQVSGLDAAGLREVLLTSDIVETAHGDTVTYHSERDAAGRVVSWTYQYDTSHAVSGSYTYDEQGRVTSLALENSQSGITEESYAYDEAGRLNTIVSSGAYSTETESYAYDDAGRISRISTENAYRTSSTYSVTDYLYDDAGRLVTVTTANDAGGMSTSYWTTYSYDDAGRLVREEFWTRSSSGEEELSYATMFTYDDAGNMVQTSYDGTYIDFLIPQSFVYDGQGRVVSASTGAPAGEIGGGSYTATYAYDDAGRLIGAESVSTYNGRESVDSYQASYNRRFIAQDAAEPAAGFSLIVYQGLAGSDTIPLVGITHPATGVVPGVELPPYNEDVYRGY